jgi:hypothetical protein
VTPDAAGRAVDPLQVPLPGWFPDPDDVHTLRWWDGSRWTHWTSDGHLVVPDPAAPAAPSTGDSDRPRATSRVGAVWLVAVIGLMVAGLAVNFGPWADGIGEPCSDRWINSFLGGRFWVLWGLTLALAAAGLSIVVWKLVVARRNGPVSTKDRLLLTAMGVLVSLGWVAAITTWPVVMWVANGLNCGL